MRKLTKKALITGAVSVAAVAVSAGTASANHTPDVHVEPEVTVPALPDVTVPALPDVTVPALPDVDLSGSVHLFH